MTEEQNINLLKQPQNTPMYFVQLDRSGYAISIEKVLYLGYSKSSRVDSWEEPGVKYFEYKQPVFYIKFKTEKGKTFTIKVDNVPYWTGLRAFDTDEHYACGDADYPFIDYYFTTSKHKLLSFLEQDGYIERVKQNKAVLDNALNFINKLKESEQKEKIRNDAL